MATEHPSAAALGAIRGRLRAGYTLNESQSRMLLAAYDAQAAQLAVAQTAGDADPALYHDMESLRRRAPFAYGQWRADLAFLLETVDAQAARLAAVNTLARPYIKRQSHDHPTCECQPCVDLRRLDEAAGAVGAGETPDGE